MDFVSTIFVLGVAAAPLAVTAGWLAGRGQRGVGSVVVARDGDGWWRSTMPWPRDVQEDDDVRWNFRHRDEPDAADSTDNDLTIEPIHPRVRVRGH